MTVIVGDLAFDNVVYDFDESPEGHALRYDAGVTSWASRS